MDTPLFVTNVAYTYVGIYQEQNMRNAPSFGRIGFARIVVLPSLTERIKKSIAKKILTYLVMINHGDI